MSDAILACCSAQILQSAQIRNVEPGLPGVDDPEPGVWETYELYQALDDDTAASGGRARTRFWKNGRLLLDSGVFATLKSRDHEIRFLELVGSWNGGAPRTQVFWVDNVQVQNFTPSRLDEFGNPCLGGSRRIARKLRRRRS